MPENYFIPKEKIITRLRFENPWWETGKLSEKLSAFPRRLYFKHFYNHVKKNAVKRAIVLMGPRRVGKTVMMHHAIESLINDGISPKKICFIGIDNPLYIHLGLEELMNLAIAASGNTHANGFFVFLDEIQYQKDWERHLKILVDSYPQTRFTVSGSAAAALKIKSTESGAGRFTDFMLPALSFQEFLHFKNLAHLVKTERDKEGKTNYDTDNLKSLNDYFIDYINYGGYPEVIFSEAVQQNMSRYLKNDIIDKVLLRDLPSLYGIKDVQELNRFFTYIAYHTGKEFSYEKIAKESGIDKVLLKKYIEYLEAAFLIKIIYKIDAGAKHFKRITAFKIYITNTSLRTALFSPVGATDTEAGSMIETAVCSQNILLKGKEFNYASWKTGNKEGEVDMVYLNPKTLKPERCAEIKWSDRYYQKPKELKSLISFCEKNNIGQAIVTTINMKGVQQHLDVKLDFIPAALFAYGIGAHALEEIY